MNNQVSEMQGATGFYKWYYAEHVIDFFLAKQVCLFIFIITPFMSLTQNTSNDCPCCGEVYHQFDFWLGEWEVFINDTTYAGKNKVIKAQDGCVIIEYWTGAKGYTGTSINYYNRQTKKWHQHWVDKAGNVLDLQGSFSENTMILRSADWSSEKEKSPPQNEITWMKNKDGTVRQLWKQTKDHGETWTVLFDGHYRKMKK